MAQHEAESRHRDKSGEISKKHGNTLMSTLPKSYGADFARGCGDDEGSAMCCTGSMSRRSASSFATTAAAACRISVVS
jgi:hypothetical protein